jgi:PucR family transcriptional regulator, purine catabolism regulatory protein
MGVVDGLRLDLVLSTPPFPQARPEVLVAGNPTVSWVHSSEIYEIASLLDGGEVLLTTGLGLVGADDDALARYAQGLARHGAAALVLELGRTFVRAPDALVAGCRRSGLALVVLHAVMPFVRLSRAANLRILDHQAEGLRRAAELSHELTSLVLERRGLHALVDHLGAAAGTAVHLVDPGGRIHAGGGGPAPPPNLEEELTLAGDPGGRLVATDTGDPHLPLLLRTAADTVRLALAGVHSSRTPDAARSLVVDLANGSVDSAEEVARRAAALGIGSDQPIATLAVTTGPAIPPGAAVERIGRTLRARLRTDLVAATDDGILAVVQASAAQRAVAEWLLTALDAEFAESGELGGIRRLAVGPVAPRLAQATASFGIALLAASTARRLGTERRLLLPADVALQRLLLETDDAVLERLVTRVLGPLLDHDAASTRPLLPTLVAYLRTGRSKAGAARELRVRRQTVHARLARIGSLIDLPPDDPAATMTLELATLAWQVRTTGVGDRSATAG